MKSNDPDRPQELRYRRRGGFVLLAFAALLLVVLVEDILNSEIQLLHAASFVFMAVACAIHWFPLLRKS